MNNCILNNITYYGTVENITWKCSHENSKTPGRLSLFVVSVF